MSQTLERIIEEVKALSEAERRELAALLHGINGAPASAPERDLEGRLARDGWLSLPVPPPSDSPSFQLAPPLIVRGRPLSEVLIEERR